MQLLARTGAVSALLVVGLLAAAWGEQLWVGALGRLSAGAPALGLLIGGAPTASASPHPSPGPLRGLSDYLHFTTSPSGAPVWVLRHACATNGTLVLQPGTRDGAAHLEAELGRCCGAGTCPRPLSEHRGAVCSALGLYVWPGPFTLTVRRADSPLRAMAPGVTLLLDVAVQPFWQFGHAMARFVQTAVLDAAFDRVLINKHVRPPTGVQHGEDTRNLRRVYNMTVAARGVPVVFGNGGEYCAEALLYVPNYERPFFSEHQADEWRAMLRRELGLHHRACPPNRAVLLRRSSDNSRRRGFVNEAVVDAVAAELGIRKLHRVTVGSRNSTEETAALFASFGLLVSTHSSQLKGLVYAAPHAAVVEVTGSFLGTRPSPFSEGMAELRLHYGLSSGHATNVTACGADCAQNDKNAAVVVDAARLKRTLAAVLDAQRTECPGMAYE